MGDHDYYLDILLKDHSPEQVLCAFHWSLSCNISLWLSKPVNIIGIQVFILFLDISCPISIALKPHSAVVN